MKGAYATVLLVEDNETDAMMVQRAFTKAQASSPIQAVGDGEKAVAYLSGQGPYGDREEYPLPALILLDLKLPRKSGLEVLQWIRQQEPTKFVPVVVLTSSAEDEDIRGAYERGANSYLVKPVEFDALLEMVKTLGLYWMVMNEQPDAQHSR